METLKQSKKLVDILKTDIGKEIYEKKEQVLIRTYKKFGFEKVDKALINIVVGAGGLAILGGACWAYLYFHNGFDSQLILSELERKLAVISTGMVGAGGIVVIGAYAIRMQAYAKGYDSLKPIKQ